MIDQQHFRGAFIALAAVGVEPLRRFIQRLRNVAGNDGGQVVGPVTSRRGDADLIRR